jgi:betaine reductase
MNQRGGGNFAKAIGEVCGLVNATGSDTRGFCAAPVHALVEAAALVQSGIYKNVVVVAGGSVAKLGMNAKDHIKKGLPVLEDVLGAFAAFIGENDGISPVFRTDIVGRHTIGSGASPQAVTQAIVADPLDRVGLKLADIDTFSVEMQNPEVTEPAGAGDVPKANYKMIAALGVMRKEFERSELNQVVDRIAMPGFAPTQGHIPSGVPFLGHCRDMMLAGELNRVMIVGKGSLFLGRLTNLFDGVSFVLERNKGVSAGGDGAACARYAASCSAGGAENHHANALRDASQIRSLQLPHPHPLGYNAPNEKTRVGLTLFGSEHDEEELRRGAALVDNPEIEVTIIEAENEKDAHARMDKMLKSGEIHAAVTMHYNFPIGVSTVGRVVTPARGRKSFIANTTGTSDTRRDAALLKNTIGAIAVAKANGNPSPTVGILNIEGANTLARNLQTLRDNGYDIRFTESARADGGIVMRGNDLLQGTPDIMVMNSLTGNVVMKTLSAFTTGGSYESVGDGYGPGVGEGFFPIINIISRTSGAPVIANAIAYAAACAKGNLPQKVREEFSAARKAGLDTLLEKSAVRNISGGSASEQSRPGSVEAGGNIYLSPPEKIVTTEIPGIEILSLEDAVQALWKNNIYATSGMGCTGPIVLVAPEDEEAARGLLVTAGYL